MSDLTATDSDFRNIEVEIQKQKMQQKTQLEKEIRDKIEMENKLKELEAEKQKLAQEIENAKKETETIKKQQEEESKKIREEMEKRFADLQATSKGVVPNNNPFIQQPMVDEKTKILNELKANPDKYAEMEKESARRFYESIGARSPL